MKDDRLEEAYDAYLERCLAGDPEDPATFGARVGADPELQARLERLHATGTRSGTPQATEAGAARSTETGLLEGFRLIEEIGTGGMGTVWLAEQVGLGREVALKRIRPELLASEATRERFRREAQAIARLSHAGIVEVHAFGEAEGGPWFAMTLLPGGSLRDLLKQRAPLPWREAVTLVAGLARALAHAHAAGLVHRDVKPENVLFAADGTAQLVDFGIVRDERAAGGLTQTFHGSPLYSAPEQLMGQPLDARCDIYALACVLHECLTGRVPFVGSSLEEVVRRCLAEDPLPPRRLVPSIPKDLETVVLAALARAPAQRTPDMDMFAQDLEAVLAGRPIQARAPGPIRRLRRLASRHPRSSALLVLALLLAVLALGWSWHQRREGRAEAQRLIPEARALIGQLVALHNESRDRIRERDLLRRMRTSHYLGDEAEATLMAAESSSARAEGQLEALHHRTLVLLREARRLGADEDQVRPVRAELFARRMHIAEGLNQGELARAWRSQAEAEWEGSTAPFRSHLTLRISSDPPGATVECFFFRELSLLEPGGERRMVPAPPEGASWPRPPGSQALRVLQPAGDLERGDLVITVQGEPVAGLPARNLAGARAEVLRRGALLELELPKAAAYAPTAAAPMGPGQDLGATPIELAGHPAERDGYLLVLRAPGCLETLRPVRPEEGDVVHVRLERPGEAPPGCVYVAAPEPFFLQRHEVTFQEYLAFLEDPATRAEVEASAVPIRTPRMPSTQGPGNLLSQDEAGTWQLQGGLGLGMPVLGVSHEDARAYARWWAVREGLDPERVALPDLAAWIEAAGGNLGRPYVHGHWFWPRWINSNFSREVPRPEAVMSYPIDESPYGLLDMAGSVSEWLETEPANFPGVKRLGGGGWGQADPARFRIESDLSLHPQQATSETGFRLLVRLGGERR